MHLEEGLMADYVIIGSGVAGLYTAICLAKHGRVAVLSKQDLTSGNTWFAQGGIAAAFSEEDSPALHFEDTWKAGGCFGWRSAIQVMVEEAPARIQDLLRMGVKFDCRNGRIDLGQEGAHSRKRILHIGGDATGKELLGALLHRAREAGVIFVENAFAERLLLVEDRCRGVVFVKDGRGYCAYARAVILATGGCGQIFKCTTNAPAATGDGLAMAFQAGAVLRDLEFFQFHPTVFFPPQGKPFLISEAVRGEGARLVNRHGEYFMEQIHPRAELGPRDIVARAILAEQQKTGGPVYLDMRHLGSAYARERFPTIYNRCLEWGIDISRDLIPVSPAAHYLIGGVQVDLDGRTAVENLFAVGEVASTGVHGANRLASNSLLEGLVFGHRVARAAAAIPPQKGGKPDILQVKASGKEEAACRAAAEPLQQLMWQHVGLIRRDAGLSQARRQLKQWWPLTGYNYAEAALNETRNMLIVAAMMVEAAAARRESRGCHYRHEYPDQDPGWAMKHIRFQKSSPLPARPESMDYPEPHFCSGTQHIMMGGEFHDSSADD